MRTAYRLLTALLALAALVLACLSAMTQVKVFQGQWLGAAISVTGLACVSASAYRRSLASRGLQLWTGNVWSVAMIVTGLVPVLIAVSLRHPNFQTIGAILIATFSVWLIGVLIAEPVGIPVETPPSPEKFDSSCNRTGSAPDTNYRLPTGPMAFVLPDQRVVIFKDHFLSAEVSELLPEAQRVRRINAFFAQYAAEHQEPVEEPQPEDDEVALEVLEILEVEDAVGVEW